MNTSWIITYFEDVEASQKIGSQRLYVATDIAQLF